MPHQDHPSSPSGLLSQYHQIESFILAKYISTTRELDRVKVQIMSGEAEVGGKSSVEPTQLICQKSPAFVDTNDSTDYTISNPDTLTKYKTAAQITHKVLETVIGNKISLLSSPIYGF